MRRLNREESRGHIVNESVRELQALNSAITTFGASLTAAATAAAARTVLGLGLASVETYAEGNWTPVLVINVTADSTYTTQIGRYIRVGDLVTVWARIVITNNGAGVGTATVSGLPFAASTIAGFIFPGQFTNYANISTTETSYFCSVASAASVIDLFAHAADTSRVLDNSDVDNDAAFSLSVTYRTGT